MFVDSHITNENKDQYAVVAWNEVAGVHLYTYIGINSTRDDDDDVKRPLYQNARTTLDNLYEDDEYDHYTLLKWIKTEKKWNWIDSDEDISMSYKTLFNK